MVSLAQTTGDLSGILMTVAFILAAGFIFLILLIFGTYRYFRNKKKETLGYEDIARQTNWIFSPNGQGLDNVKAYFDHINRQVLGDRIRLGTFPVNILWGTIEGGIFASFDFTYNRSVHMGSNLSPQYEKGFLLISDKMNLRQFSIEKRNSLLKAIDGLVNKFPLESFEQNFEIKSNAFSSNTLTPEIKGLIAQNRLIRCFGNGQLLCIFTPREALELPDANRIKFNLDLLWKLAHSLKKY